MRLRLLVLAAVVAMLPATAPALSLQYNLDGAGFVDFPVGALAPINLGTHTNVQIRIAQNAAAGDAVQGYILNLAGTAGGLKALQFSDMFDSDQDGIGDTPVDVTCRVRPAADSNCGANFLGPLPPGSRPVNDVIFGTGETFGSDVSANLVVFSRLDLAALQVGATMTFSQGSSIVLGGAAAGTELNVAGLGFQVVPEPGTVLLLGAGLAGLALAGRKRA